MGEKTVIYLDGHTDTVQAVRPRWHEPLGGGVDPCLGLTDPSLVDCDFLIDELGYLPPECEWDHLLWGRSSADQLGGVVAKIVATQIFREHRAEGNLVSGSARGPIDVLPVTVDGRKLKIASSDYRPGRIEVESRRPPGWIGAVGGLVG